MKTLQLNRPHILILVGVPGSGRTTFANRFSNLFQAPFIDIKSFASTAASGEVLAELGSKIVEQLVKTNQTIVYEGITGTRAERQAIAKIAREAGYAPLLVWFQVNQATAQQRASKNSRSAHPILADVYADGKFTAPTEREPYVVVSGMHTYPAQAKTVLKRLTELSGRTERPVAEVKTRSDTPAASRSIRVQ